MKLPKLIEQTRTLVNEASWLFVSDRPLLALARLVKLKELLNAQPELKTGKSLPISKKRKET